MTYRGNYPCWQVTHRHLSHRVCVQARAGRLLGSLAAGQCGVGIGDQRAMHRKDKPSLQRSHCMMYSEDLEPRERSPGLALTIRCRLTMSGLISAWHLNDIRRATCYLWERRTS